MDVDTFKGFVLGMEKMGAKLVKIESSDIFFNIRNGSDIDDSKKLSRSKKAFSDFFGLRLRVRRIE